MVYVKMANIAFVVPCHQYAMFKVFFQKFLS